MNWHIKHCIVFRPISWRYSIKFIISSILVFPPTFQMISKCNSNFHPLHFVMLFFCQLIKEPVSFLYTRLWKLLMISKVVQLVLLNQYHFFMLSDEVKNNSRDPFTKFMFNQKSPNIVWGNYHFCHRFGGNMQIFTING